MSYYKPFIVPSVPALYLLNSYMQWLFQKPTQESGVQGFRILKNGTPAIAMMSCDDYIIVADEG